MENKNHIHDIERTEKHLTRQIILNDIGSGDTDFLKKTYVLLNQHDNLRLLEKEKTQMKFTFSISNHIYEDILELIIEEIFDKNNTEVLEFFIGHYANRFHVETDTIKFDTDSKLFMELLIAN